MCVCFYLQLSALKVRYRLLSSFYRTEHGGWPYGSYLIRSAEDWQGAVLPVSGDWCTARGVCLRWLWVHVPPCCSIPPSSTKWGSCEAPSITQQISLQLSLEQLPNALLTWIWTQSHNNQEHTFFLYKTGRSSNMLIPCKLDTKQCHAVQPALPRVQSIYLHKLRHLTPHHSPPLLLSFWDAQGLVLQAEHILEVLTTHTDPAGDQGLALCITQPSKPQVTEFMVLFSKLCWMTPGCWCYISVTESHRKCFNFLNNLRHQIALLNANCTLYLILLREGILLSINPSYWPLYMK